jgi:hypothetical protein
MTGSQGLNQVLVLNREDRPHASWSMDAPIYFPYTSYVLYKCRQTLCSDEVSANPASHTPHAGVGRPVSAGRGGKAEERKKVNEDEGRKKTMQPSPTTGTAAGRGVADGGEARTSPKTSGASGRGVANGGEEENLRVAGVVWS